MKKIKYFNIILITVLFVASCKQDVIKPTDPIPPTVVTPSKGSADFTKFVAVGDSYTAGFQAGALFNDGQATSMAKIMATQFATVGGGAFNQPDINSVNGFNSSSSNPLGGIIRGRLVLFDPDGATDPDGTGCQVSRSAGPRAAGTPETTTTCPSTVITKAMPAPYNTADLPSAYGGTKSALNNFGVPGAKLLEAAAVPNYGTLNPYFGRFATDPVNKTLVADAAEKQGSFFMLYLGNFDVLGYATSGGVGSTNGTTPIDMTPEANFNALFNGALTAMLATPNSKGVVGNIPDITTLPFFFTVLWNQIEFKATDCNVDATLAQLNGAAGFGGYNGALDFLASPAGGNTITTAEAAKRKVRYAIGKNGILIADETLVDLTAALSAINPALGAYGRVRQATAQDLITLSAGGVLNTCAIPPGGTVPSATYLTGITAPLSDQFVLLPTETSDILTRTAAFNTILKNAVDATASGGRVALADINKAYKDLLANKAFISDGVTIQPTFAPPTAAFSEDGVHPNSRGYAFTANVFIDAINVKFAAAIPKASLAAYKGTGLPITPP